MLIEQVSRITVAQPPPSSGCNWFRVHLYYLYPYTLEEDENRDNTASAHGPSHLQLGAAGQEFGVLGCYVALPQEGKAVETQQEVRHARRARFHGPRECLQHLQNTGVPHLIFSM